MTSSKIIVGNWKMGGNLKYAYDLEQQLNILKLKNDIIVCPPYPYLMYFGQKKSNHFSLGAQNCHHLTEGPHTGEVSISMLKEVGCKYVILGHSERRQQHQETDDLVSEKAQLAYKNSLIPIICIGETAEQYQQKKTMEVLAQQVANSVPEIGQYILAYEPVWSIGSGKTPSLEDIEKIYNLLKIMIKQHTPYANAKILYGGSVSTENFQGILSFTDGVLAGGASLKIEQFIPISQYSC